MFGRALCNFTVKLFSFMNGLVFVFLLVGSQRGRAAVCGYTQKFPCCVVPPNMMLDETQREREKDNVYTGGDVTVPYNQKMDTRHCSPTVPPIMTLYCTFFSVLFYIASKICCRSAFSLICGKNVSSLILLMTQNN